MYTQPHSDYPWEILPPWIQGDMLKKFSGVLGGVLDSSVEEWVCKSGILIYVIETCA